VAERSLSCRMYRLSSLPPTPVQPSPPASVTNEACCMSFQRYVLQVFTNSCSSGKEFISSLKSCQTQGNILRCCRFSCLQIAYHTSDTVEKVILRRWQLTVFREQMPIYVEKVLHYVCHLSFSQCNWCFLKIIVTSFLNYLAKNYSIWIMIEFNQLVC
jgi:hypothetical protein